jgi:hypothetical protein
MNMVDEMIETVRAAFAPEADAAAKQRAASVLRGLLGVLDGGIPSATTAAVQAPSDLPRMDLLTAIVEYVRPHLPEEALAQMPRLRMPLIDFGAATTKR